MCTSVAPFVIRKLTMRSKNRGLLRDIPVLNPDVAVFEWSGFKVVNLDLHAVAIEHLRHFTKVLVDAA